METRSVPAPLDHLLPHQLRHIRTVGSEFGKHMTGAEGEYPAIPAKIATGE